MQARAMKQNAKLRWLSVIQVVTALSLFPVFSCWAPWLDAIPREQALAQFPGQVGVGWKAVIVDHGSIREWQFGAVSQNLVGFTLCTLLLAALLALLFWTTWLVHRLKGEPR